MIKTITLFILTLIPCSSFAASISISGGTGYKQTLNNNLEYLSVNAGISTYAPVKKISAIGFEYYFVTNAENANDADYFSSLFIFSYRNYFFQRHPKKDTKRIFIPFFSISHNIAIENHRDYSPGIEIQIGTDIIYHVKLMLNPLDIVSYIASHLFRRKQLLTISMFAGVYYYKSSISYNTGVRISSGILF